jgi:hypothetical protein
MNEFLERLLTELPQTHDPDRRAELLARIAGIRARLGDFDGAKRNIEELRAIYGDGRSGVVTVSINLAEGLVHHFGTFRPQALDRFNRAQVLSVAMKYDAGVALSSAWKANYHFEFEEYGEMARCLLLATQHASAEDHDALTRLGMVLFNAFTMLGNKKAAQHWFMRTKDAASSNRDRSSIEALLYNKAAFSITRARAEHCLCPVSHDDLRSIRMDALSAKNYQDLSKLASLPEHLVLWDARLKILEGDYSGAQSLLVAIRDSERFASHNFSKSFIDLEIAYCQGMSGDLTFARSLPLSSTEYAFEDFDVDEQLVAAWMKVRLADLDETLIDREVTQAKLDQRAQAYQGMMNRLADQLGAFAD